MAETFWRFLEAELSARRLGSMPWVQADPRIRNATQTVYDWCAQRCCIRPATATCLAWAVQLNKDAMGVHASVHVDEPAWKRRLDTPVHFAAVAEGGEAKVPVDGVVRVHRDGLALLVAGENSGIEFTPQSVRRVTLAAGGLRLEVGPPLPYGGVLLLASNAASLDAALQRAGIVRDREC